MTRELEEAQGLRDSAARLVAEDICAGRIESAKATAVLYAEYKTKAELIRKQITERNPLKG